MTISTGLRQTLLTAPSAKLVTETIHSGQLSSVKSFAHSRRSYCSRRTHCGKKRKICKLPVPLLRRSPLHDSGVRSMSPRRRLPLTSWVSQLISAGVHQAAAPPASASSRCSPHNEKSAHTAPPPLTSSAAGSSPLPLLLAHVGCWVIMSSQLASGLASRLNGPLHVSATKPAQLLLQMCWSATSTLRLQGRMSGALRSLLMDFFCGVAYSSQLPPPGVPTNVSWGTPPPQWSHRRSSCRCPPKQGTHLLGRRGASWSFSAWRLPDAGVLLPTSSGCWFEHKHALPSPCSVAAARSFAASLLALPISNTANVDGKPRLLSDVLPDSAKSPPLASRLT